MAITLPAGPLPIDSVEPVYLRRGTMLVPIKGGIVQSMGHLGDRIGAAVPLPAMDEDCAAEWIAARMRSANEKTTVRWLWPTRLLDMTGKGTPLVKGAGQQAPLLATDGWTAGAVIPVGTPFNVPDALARPYLHFTVAAVTANGSGEASLPIAPMLRIIPADNAALNFAAPVIEGWMDAGDISWTVERLEFYGLSFTIAEAR